jgi:hypothetical protein
MTDKDREIQWLRAENDRLKKQIERYVVEFRVCRFCKHMHEDCSPTGIECTPVWGGL